MALACFVHFLYTVRSTVSKKYTKQANRQKTRKYKKKHHTHTHKLSVQKHQRSPGSVGFDFGTLAPESSTSPGALRVFRVPRKALRHPLGPTYTPAGPSP